MRYAPPSAGFRFSEVWTVTNGNGFRSDAGNYHGSLSSGADFSSGGSVEQPSGLELASDRSRGELRNMSLLAQQECTHVKVFIHLIHDAHLEGRCGQNRTTSVFGRNTTPIEIGRRGFCCGYSCLFFILGEGETKLSGVVVTARIATLVRRRGRWKFLLD